MTDGTKATDEQMRSRRGVDISTLVVAALASVIAAVVTSKLWASGTLISTAMTPVIVSLLKEWLQRPAEKIGDVAKAPLVAVRSASPLAPSRARSSAPPEAERRGRVIEAPPPDPDPHEYERLETLLPPGEEASTTTPYRVYRERSSRRAWWAVGAVTGALAFVVAAVTITLPELVGGGSVAGTGSTTLFGHHRHKASGGDQQPRPTTETSPSREQTTTAPEPKPQSTTTTPEATPPTQTTPESSGGTPTQTTPSQKSTPPPPTPGQRPAPTHSTPPSPRSSPSRGGG